MARGTCDTKIQVIEVSVTIFGNYIIMFLRVMGPTSSSRNLPVPKIYFVFAKKPKR